MQVTPSPVSAIDVYFHTSYTNKKKKNILKSSNSEGTKRRSEEIIY